MTEIPTYYLLQDVIETFFGKIRSRCGFNNNPNVDQFKGAYRTLLANLETISSDKSNCRIVEALDSDSPHTEERIFVFYLSK